MNNNALSDILNVASFGDHDAIVAIRMAAQNMAAGINSVLSLFAREAHDAIAKWLEKHRVSLPILYGGSVNATSAASLSTIKNF